MIITHPILKATPYKTYENFINCGCSCSHEKTNCYFYESVQDMGAHIPTCNYYGKLGYCPCKNCEKFISEKDVYNKIKNYVDKKFK